MIRYFVVVHGSYCLALDHCIAVIFPRTELLRQVDTIGCNEDCLRKLPQIRIFHQLLCSMHSDHVSTGLLSLDLKVLLLV